MGPGFDIILSYRRDDSAGHAGRLYDDLAQRFGDDHVFMDIDAIDPGVDFNVAIERAVASASVFLAMIGSRWLTLTDDEGRRRIDAPGDVVRFEIESALRPDVRVIPLLVQNAAMPAAEELPPSIAPLAYRNALELRDSSWRYDVDRLIDTIEKVRREGHAAAASATGPPSDRPRERGQGRNRRTPLAIAVAVLLAGGVAVLAVLLLRSTSDSGSSATPTASVPTTTPAQTISTPALRAGPIVFAGPQGFDSQIRTAGLDGKRQPSLTSGESPDWSPHGDNVVYARVEKKGLCVVDVSAGNRNPVVLTDERDGTPHWSPDGRRIAFDRERGTSGLTDVWVVSVDGGEATQLTSPSTASRGGGQPDWSPDGRRIVYGRRGVLWTMDADGKNQRKLLQNDLTGLAQLPSWSPDGTMVAFSLTGDIFVVASDGVGGPRNLTNGNVPDASGPVWSPNGKQILFAARPGLMTIPSGDGSARTLVRGSALRTPAWRATTSVPGASGAPTLGGEPCPTEP